MHSHRFMAATLLCAAALLPGASLPASAHAYSYGTQCGVELWATKTLRDPGAHAINFTLHDTTVAWLDHQHAPADPDAVGHRIAPVETTLWRVRVQLVGYRIEEDGDYHLVLRDPHSGSSMIGEIPAPYCVASRADQYRALRAAVDRIGHHHATRRWWWLDYHGATPPTITISGVGFFDRIHDQDGVAPNGVELHPVLGISR
jgi:hypothetical protein